MGKEFKNIDWLVENDGQFSIGRAGPIPCAAVASDEHNMLVALVRRKGESLQALMQRVEEGLELAWEQEIFTDEVNG